MSDTEKRLYDLTIVPSGKDAFHAWLLGEDAISFLQENIREEEFVVYAALPHVFLHAMLIPDDRIEDPEIKDLMQWDYTPFYGWSFSYNFEDPASITVMRPPEGTGSKILDNGEQLVFFRTFEGRLGEKTYCELSQKVAQILQIHFLEERNAYCRIDERGEIEEMARIVSIPEKGKNSQGMAVFFKRSLLDEYMALTGTALVRMFEFCRFSDHFIGWQGGDEKEHAVGDTIFHRQRLLPDYASYLRGIQVVRTPITKADLHKKYASSRSEEKRKHVSFVAHDWKNKEVKEISCAPGETANYFTKSDLSFEMSPAFFRPEVLQKYKADSMKYTLEDRSISCRGAWHLETYDINDAGQVHTYLVYLRNLPYEEQLHWKAYNEEPKGPISKRAFQTDFQGSFDVPYDPLTGVKGQLYQWNEERVPWWTLRNEDLPNQAHYPITTSFDEWATEIHNLDKFIVEGFESDWLRKTAEVLGRESLEGLRSLKLIEACFMGLGIEEEEARGITAPLHRVHDLRSLNGHASDQSAVDAQRQALKEHGSLKKHFYELCRECDDSLQKIFKYLQQSKK